MAEDAVLLFTACAGYQRKYSWLSMVAVRESTPGSTLADLRLVDVRVRVQIIRHFKTCKTDIYLQNECAHVGLSVHAPVHELGLTCISSLRVTRDCDNTCTTRGCTAHHP